jgi:hypothetical protein
MIAALLWLFCNIKRPASEPESLGWESRAEIRTYFLGRAAISPSWNCNPMRIRICGPIRVKEVKLLKTKQLVLVFHMRQNGARLATSCNVDKVH